MNVVNLNNHVFGNGFGDADFDIDLKQLHFSARSPSDYHNHWHVTNKRAVIRTDTNQCLGIVGPNYKPVNHRDMIANQRSMIMRSDLNTKDIVESIVTDRYGARCYVKHTLPNQFLETPDGDTAALTFLGVNSFDGLFSFMLSAGARQSACMNGQVFTEGSSTIYKARHTRQLDIHKGSQIVGRGLEVMMQQNELWKIWYKTVPSQEIINTIFAEAVGMSYMDENIHNNRNYIYLWRVFTETYSKRQGNNLWAVYNALTDWATHCQPARKGASVVSLRNRRANKVSKVISNSRLFGRVA